MKTIILCGEQGIALRGHRETGNAAALGSSDAANDGNFRALLRFRIDAGDAGLEKHLIGGPKNATYTSPDI